MRRIAAISAVQASAGRGFGKGLIDIAVWQRGRVVEEKRIVRRSTTVLHLWCIQGEVAVIEEDRANRVVIKHGQFISGKPAWRLCEVIKTQGIESVAERLRARKAVA